MTVGKLADILNSRIAVLADGEREVLSAYCGDFLSNVMGKAPADCVWFTVMSNVNVCAVAALTDCAAAVLCEGVQPDAALAERAAEKGVNLLLTDLPVYEAAVLVSGYIKR